MCFYDQHRFACGDWKWGHFRQHCNREYRLGETCGIKLVMQTYGLQMKCKTCEKIDTKRRRLQHEQERLQRWAREPNKYSAPMEKAVESINILNGEIYMLECERQEGSQAIGHQTSHVPNPNPFAASSTMTLPFRHRSMPWNHLNNFPGIFGQGNIHNVWSIPQEPRLVSNLQGGYYALGEQNTDASCYGSVHNALSLLQRPRTPENSASLKSQEQAMSESKKLHTSEAVAKPGVDQEVLGVTDKLIAVCMEPDSQYQEQVVASLPKIETKLNSVNTAESTGLSTPFSNLGKGPLPSSQKASLPSESSSVSKGVVLPSTTEGGTYDSEDDIETISEDSWCSWTDSSDSSGFDEDSNPHFRLLRTKVPHVLLKRFDGKSKIPFKSCAGDGNQTQPSGRIKDGSRAPPNITVKSQNGKRPTGNRGDESPNDDEENSKRRQISSPVCQTAGPRLLACPFYKYNRRCYKKCSTSILREISRLKQHLERNHRVPLHCASCFQIFELEADRDTHTRRRNCEVLPPKIFEGINDYQRRLLKKRCPAQKTREENWYMIYDILFPDAPTRPDNPYLEETLSAELLAFKDFCSIDGPEILRSVVSSELPEEMRFREDEVQRIFQAAFQDSLQIILERWEAFNSTTGSITTSTSQQSLHVPPLAQLQAPSGAQQGPPWASTTILGLNNAASISPMPSMVLYGPSAPPPGRNLHPTEQAAGTSLSATSEASQQLPLAESSTASQQTSETLLTGRAGTHDTDTFEIPSSWEESLVNLDNLDLFPGFS